MSSDAVTNKLSLMFANLDFDGNGLVSEEEFIQKCLEGNVMESEDSQKEKFQRKNQSEEKTRARSFSRQLNKSDLEYLEHFTRFSKAEIKDWFKGFIHDCPSGKLKKGKVVEMYSMILPERNALVFVDHIFRIFDKDNNGNIDFKVDLPLATSGNIVMKFVKSGIHDCY